MAKTDEKAAPQASSRRAKDQRRIPLSMRITPEIRGRLEEAASASGRSITQEAELRIAMALHDEDQIYNTLSRAYGRQLAGLLILIGEALRDVGPILGILETGSTEGGENWIEAPHAFDLAVQGINFALEAMRPEGDPMHNAVVAEEYRGAGFLGRADGGPVGAMTLDQVVRDGGREAVKSYLRAATDPVAHASARPRAKETVLELRNLLAEPAMDRIARYLDRQNLEEAGEDRPQRTIGSGSLARGSRD